MEGKPKFKIIYSDEMIAFLRGLSDGARKKIMYNINKSKFVIDKEIFKKLGDTEIWEFRTLYEGVKYRVFAFWDKTEDAIVLTTHGIVKKTQRVPLKEIKKAESKRKEYFESKDK